MNVSGIRPYEGFYHYNSIKLDELRNQQMSAIEQQTKPEINQTDVISLEKQIAATKERQTFKAADYAKQYQPDVTYDMKGVDSDINSLDVEKAVSDLGKDQMLQQYQYFVGNDRNLVQNQEQQRQPATMHSGENFVL